ncbi:MAG: helix-turn-helix transcriptional regulator [Acholeplasmataceae bacterium]|nr:helix-turn-helix transcriptional regulator [Acholeplasmataceae bacterium]
MKSEELCSYLERIRSARNISQEIFTNGIVSLRQYRRYLNGESDIPFQVVDKLSEKLGIQTINLLSEIEATRYEETKKVDKFYNAVVNYSKNDVLNLISYFENLPFIDPENKLLYLHGVSLHMLLTNQVTRGETVQKNKELINYPLIFKKSIITLNEMVILSSILDYSEDPVDAEEISTRLKAYLQNRSFVLGTGHEPIFNLVLFRLARYSGKNNLFDDVISYCNMGIERNHSQKFYYLLDYFYYYSSLAYYQLGDMVNYEIMLVKCFNILHTEGNEKKIEKFALMIYEDFNIIFNDFVVNYYQKHNQE